MNRVHQKYQRGNKCNQRGIFEYKIPKEIQQYHNGKNVKKNVQHMSYKGNIVVWFNCFFATKQCLFDCECNNRKGTVPSARKLLFCAHLPVKTIVSIGA